MNFQQLRILSEAVRQNFNLTEVASALYTSQPGVSRHIRDLEEELGVDIFVRKGKRLLGLTEPGRELMPVVERVLRDAGNLKQMARQFADKDTGSLTLATTHTQARYALPETIGWFRRQYPNVHLALHQGSPQEIATLLLEGRADIGMATETLADVPGLIVLPCYSWRHAAIVPKGHPLDRLTESQGRPPTLEELAEHPIVTYQPGFTGRGHLDETFAKAGLAPDIVLSAIDADVLKTYVGMGFGVGLIAEMAYSPERDTNLKLIPLMGLFPSSTTRLAVRRGAYLRGYAVRLLEKLSPDYTGVEIEAMLRQENRERDEADDL